MSAGLSLPRQCRQEFGLTRFRISITRFCTNCFHTRFSFLTTATLLSSQSSERNLVIVTPEVKPPLRLSVIWRQDNGSSGGIVCLSVGALVLDAKNLTHVCWQFLVAK